MKKVVTLVNGLTGFSTDRNICCYGDWIDMLTEKMAAEDVAIRGFGWEVFRYDQIHSIQKYNGQTHRCGVRVFSHLRRICAPALAMWSAR